MTRSIAIGTGDVVLLVSLLSLGWRSASSWRPPSPNACRCSSSMLEPGRFFDRITLGALILSLGLS